ncbi:MAG: ankyrin repeat domain-containing protein [Pseudomonadota bacterium]
MSRTVLIAVLLLASSLLAPSAHADSLALAVRDQQPTRAMQFLADRADVNSTDEDGTSALQWAVHFGYSELVDRLIQAKADVRHVSDFGATAMSEAAVRGDTQVIGKLLKAGADPDSANDRGQTALMLIARTANVQAARELLRKGATVNAIETTKGQTALMWAAAQSQPQMIRELLARGAKVDVVSTVAQHQRQVSGEPRAQHRQSGGYTALLFAARQGCLSCVQVLVEQGKADIEVSDPDGITPLNLAIDNFNFDIGAYLLSRGADPNLWDLWGRTPLYLAVDLNTVPRGGRADMASLDQTTSLRMIELLLAAKANTNLQLKLFPPYRSVGADRGGDQLLTIGSTPLLRAARAADVPAVKLLLAQGARTDLPQIAGITPLLAAAGLGASGVDTRGTLRTEPQMVETIELLLAAGSKVNEVDSQGRTAMHGAAMGGRNDIVKLLAARGADIATRDARGFTPLDYAQGKGGGPGRGQAATVQEKTAALLQQLVASK